MHYLSYSTIGSEITKVSAPSALLNAEIFPLCPFIIGLLMCNPRPVPCFVLPPKSLVANYSNNLERISSGIYAARRITHDALMWWYQEKPPTKKSLGSCM